MNGIPATLQDFLNRNTWIALVATTLVGIAAVVFRPPTWVLDALIVINWASALALFGLVFRIESASNLASFPTILQLATNLRILTLFAVLTNIVMTFEAGRLVTRLAPSFDREAMVATIMTLLLLVLMYKILLAKGSDRISMVLARYAVDRLPGIQMGIEADVRSGAIDSKEAQRRREAEDRNLDFRAACEGAAKFINAEGNLVLIATALGIIAAITGSQLADEKRFRSLGEAASESAKLVGGAGLAVILPAIMMSLAMILLITKSSGDRRGSSIGDDVREQMLQHPVVLGMVGFAMLVAGVVMRNLFGAILTLVGTGAILFARQKMKSRDALVKSAKNEEVRVISRGERRPLSPLVFELSEGLIAELGADANGAQRHAVEYMEQHVYDLLGLKIPQPDLLVAGIPGCQLRLLLSEIPVMEIELPAGMWFVPSSCGEGAHWTGNRVFGDVVGRFVPAADVPDGVTAHGIAGALPLVFTAALLRHAYDFVDTTQVQQMLAQTATVHRDLVTQTNEAIKTVELVDLLKGLVKEQISIRDTRRILEAVMRGVQRGLKSDLLLDYVRSELSLQIAYRFAPARVLHCIQITNDATVAIEKAQLRIPGGVGEPRVNMPQAQRDAFEQDIREACNEAIARGFRPVIVCRQVVRLAMYILARGPCPDVVVLAAEELPPDFAVKAVAKVGDSVPPASAGNE